MASSGNTIYFGGDFSQVWANSGGGAVVDANTGAIAAKSKVPYVAGAIFASASDGKGGWYIGGNITKVGNSSRDLLAHINSDGSLDANWSFTVSGTGKRINKIVVSGNDIYVGGTFTQITDAVNTYGRTNLARLKADGTVDASWSPNASGVASTVNALALSGNTLYVGGIFDTISTVSRNHLAALNTSNGSAKNWNPGLPTSPTNVINDIAVHGDVVYVAGGFNTTIGGQSRRYLAALSATDAGAAANGFNPDPILPVYTIAVSQDGNTVFVGGLFYSGGIIVSIGGGNLDFLAALNASNGTAILTWTPNPDQSIHTLALSGNTLYVGGSFSTINGSARTCAAALSTDTSTTTLRDWAPETDDAVWAFGISGSKVYVGGAYGGINVATRNRAAAVDGATGLLTSWNPNVTGSAVWCLAVDGNTVYMGGNYTNAGGAARTNLAGISTKTGLADTFNPDPDDIVYGLKVYNNIVYAGGDFTGYLAAYDPATSDLAAGWTTPVLNNSVYAIEAANGILYAGGIFTTVGGDGTYQYLAAFNAGTGALTKIKGFDFDPMYALSSCEVDVPHPGRTACCTPAVHSTVLSEDSPSKNLADIDISNLPGTTTNSWNPNPLGTVAGLSVLNKTLYASGGFSSAGGVTTSVAAIDMASGTVSSTWTPTLNNVAYAIKAFGNMVIVGGSFSTVNGSLSFPSLVAIDLKTGLPWGY